MEKPADTDLPVHELIKRRWSPRAFSAEPVDGQTLASIFEAARWAPSCYNDQPWEFIVAPKNNDSETYQALLDALVEGNRTWAKEAPVLGCSLARTRFNHNGKSNDHAWHDVGLAMENMVLEALNRDVFVHQMAGFSSETITETFSLPEDREPVAMFAMGYPGNPEDLPEDRRDAEQSPRTRKPRDEFVFTEENQPGWME